ncbi:MAG TPA: phosphoribosylanthranilate isomerase [Candidatus Nanoarchaeia archaeon]|nr:phosphoribosylanthranilate isomerase [Candidatus Nanoarchaeia archaeon]
MTKIKICGITNFDDAKNAINLGADFLGFNFYNKSPRYVDCGKAKDILGSLAGKTRTVGVFVNEKIDRIEKISNYCNLDLIQLSGNEMNNIIVKLKKKTDKKIIKCFHIKDKTDAKNIQNFECDYLLLDNFRKGFYGGTGQRFDLDIAENLDSRKLFLAGGMDKNNVKAAIQKINPYAVDVCSSIESGPGKKDYDLMKNFIEAVR